MGIQLSSNLDKGKKINEENFVTTRVQNTIDKGVQNNTIIGSAGIQNTMNIGIGN